MIAYCIARRPRTPSKPCPTADTRPTFLTIALSLFGARCCQSRADFLAHLRSLSRQLLTARFARLTSSRTSECIVRCFETGRRSRVVCWRSAGIATVVGMISCAMYCHVEKFVQPAIRLLLSFGESGSAFRCSCSAPSELQRLWSAAASGLTATQTLLHCFVLLLSSLPARRAHSSMCFMNTRP